MPPSLHRYLYAFGNPLLYVDPDGRFPIVSDIANFFHERSDAVGSTLESVQREHSSTVATRSVAALSGIGGALLDVAGGAVDLVDTALDAGTSYLQNTSLKDSKIVQNSSAATARRGRAIGKFASDTKNYAIQNNLGDALASDAGKAANATGGYLNDVFVEGKLTATASFSGGAFDIAAGATAARAAKLGKSGSSEPELTVEPINSQSEQTVTVYRGESTEAQSVHAKAVQDDGLGFSEGVYQQRDLDQLKQQHARSSDDPRSLLISTTTDPEVAKHFAGPGGVVNEYKIPKNKIHQNEHNNMVVNPSGTDDWLPENEWVVPLKIEEKWFQTSVPVKDM